MPESMRQLIIKLFNNEGKPVPLETIALQEKISLEEVQKKLEITPLLDNFCNLRYDQVITLIDFYGEGILFNKKLEDDIMGYLKTREKIKAFEERSKRKRQNETK